MRVYLTEPHKCPAATKPLFLIMHGQHSGFVAAGHLCGSLKFAPLASPPSGYVGVNRLYLPPGAAIKRRRGRLDVQLRIHRLHRNVSAV